MEFNKNKKKIRDKSFFFVWMACLIFSLFFIAYFFFLRTSEVDVTKHIILQYSGENGSASLQRGGAQRGDQRQSAAAGFL